MAQDNGSVRVLVVGAGRTGARVLRQLQKNPKLVILTLDPRPNPYAVEAGLVEQIDVVEALTPLTMEYIVSQTEPDLILLTTTTEDLALGTASGIDVLADALREELAAVSTVPLIQVSRSSV